MIFLNSNIFQEVSIIENNQDFIITNGVLFIYKGPGGDVTIPEGVAKIGEDAFAGCKSLTSVTIPGTVTEIHKSVFTRCRPVLIAPHTPVSGIVKEDKPGACAGFAKAYLDGAELDEEIKAGYLKYIKGQKRLLFPAAVRHEELLQPMFVEKMLDRKDINPLLAECDKQNNIAAKAAVLDYAGRNLKPVDSLKEFKLKDL